MYSANAGYKTVTRMQSIPGYSPRQKPTGVKQRVKAVRRRFDQYERQGCYKDLRIGLTFVPIGRSYKEVVERLNQKS